MSLETGARLGSYDIVGAIGAGGMGEVYRAHDARLNRDVAIKILPAAFGADADRLARFEREAQTLAALNHPNIASIYGIAEAPDGTLTALVMELVDGPTLEEVIRTSGESGLPLADAVAIARQIAEALEAAHEQGIIHRDLKPANVKVRADGTVKVLDFGLAKAIDSASPQHQMNSPTLTARATEMGIVLGTAAYMSPEQAKGKPVDRRADIWAFGVVLYEMLTGRTLFACETTSETVAAVLRADIDLTAVPASTPAAVRRLMERCLERDPRLRLRDIGEARVLLSAPAPDGVRPWSDPMAGAPDASGVGVRPRSDPWRGALSAAAWTIGGIALGSAAAWLFTGRTPPPAVPREDFTLQRLTELPGAEEQPDISPDGRHVLYTSAASGNRDVYLLRVGGARALNLTQNSTADDDQAMFSPDGERIAFHSTRDGGGIFIMGATGESVRRVTSSGFDPAWSPDGATLAYGTEGVVDPYSRNSTSELWTVDVGTGRSVRLFEGDGVQPVWSPDGSRIAFWANTGGQRDIWTISVRGGTPLRVTDDAPTDWSPEWSPDGRALYFSSDRGGAMNLWRIAIDPHSGAARGVAEPITNSVTALGYARATRDGRRIAVMGHSRSYELSLASFDPTGTAGAGEARLIRSPSLCWCAPSPRGDWLACTSRGTREDIVLMRADGSETVRLTDDAFKDRIPTWSVDGTRIGFMSTRSGQWELWSMTRDGADLRQMTDLKANIFEAVWSPDGRRAATGASISPPIGTWLFDTSSTATPSTARFIKDPGNRFSPEEWSPDGSRIAGSLLSNAGLPMTPAVMDVQSGALTLFDMPPLGNSATSGLVAGWLPDGRRIVVMSRSGASILDTTTKQWAPVASGAPGTLYRLSRDGRMLLIERTILDADVWLLEKK